jgi:hypothetical protein
MCGLPRLTGVVIQYPGSDGTNWNNRYAVT